jgi:hypothetical protein
MDAAIARAVQPFLRNVSVRQLMPWPKIPEKEATLDDVMDILKFAKK